MKTIHNLKDKIAALLPKKASNMTIQLLLKQSLGVEKTNDDHSGEFRDLSGVWSKQDADELEKATRELEVVNKEE